MKKTLTETKEKIIEKFEEFSDKKSDTKQILISLTTRSVLKFWLICLVFVFL